MNRPLPTRVTKDKDESPGAPTWSPERIALLHLHYLQGLTAAESARDIGGVTRNAVISKRYRMGLFGRVTPAPRLKRVETNDGAVRYRRLAPREETLAVTPLPAMDWPPPPDARPARMADRPEHSCAWPLGPAAAPGDAATLFCCAPYVGPGPYCESHRQRARRIPDVAPAPPAPGRR